MVKLTLEEDNDIVPDSDPFAPPSDWVPILPNRYTENLQKDSEDVKDPPQATTCLDDVVPDSDPPYPPWMEVLLPYEARLELVSPLAPRPDPRRSCWKPEHAVYPQRGENGQTNRVRVS